MDFKSILSVAKENKIYADQEIPIKRYSTEISAPKKPPKSGVKSNAVQAFLARKQQEEEQKAIDAEIRRRELLDKRSEAKHNRKATTMAKRTKDNNFMTNWQFNPNKDENEELKTLNPYAGPSNGAPTHSKHSRGLHPDRREEASKEPPPKPRLLQAPVVDFHDLLHLASKKQHQPITLPRIPKKKPQPTGDVQLQGRPMTNSEKRRFIEEQARSEGRSLASVTLPEHHPRTRFRLGEGDDPNGEFVPNYHLQSQSLGIKASATQTTSIPNQLPIKCYATKANGDRPRAPTSGSTRSGCLSARKGGSRPSQESQCDATQRRLISNGTTIPRMSDAGRPLPAKRPADQRANGNSVKPPPSRPAPLSSTSSGIRRDVNSSKSTPGGAIRGGCNSVGSSSSLSSRGAPEASGKNRPQPSVTTNGRMANSIKPGSAPPPPTRSQGQSRPTPSGKPQSVSRPSERGRPIPADARIKGAQMLRSEVRPKQVLSRNGVVGATPSRPASKGAAPSLPAKSGTKPSGPPSRPQPSASSVNGRPARPNVPMTSRSQPSSSASTSRVPTPSSSKQQTGRPPPEALRTANKSVSGKQKPPAASVQRRPEGGGPPPKQFPPKDLAPRQFPPNDMAPKQFPPRDMLPKQFPPRDMLPKPLTQTLGRRGPIKPGGPGTGSNKRRIESDDEYDAEMDDFIDDGPVAGETIDFSQHIREIFGYDRNKYAYESYDDLDRMESSFAQQMKEEAISSKLGIMEDLEDIQREQDEIKRKKITSKRVKRK